MSSSSKKSGHRFNIIDVLIIIGIIIIVVFCVNMVNGGMFGDDIHKVSYRVKIDGVAEETYSVLEKGVKVYAGDINAPVGVISNVEYEKMTVTSLDISNDRFVTKEHDSLYTVYLDIEAGCVLENGAFQTESMKISANTDIDINVPFLYKSAKIISVSDITDAEE